MGNSQCCAPMALPMPGMVAVTGNSLPRCPCIPWGPGSTSLPFLAPSQSVSAGISGERFPPASQIPPPWSPQGGSGTSSHCAPPSLEMDPMGLRERCQWGPGHRENRSCRIHQIPTLPKSPSPFPLAESLNSSPDPTKVPRPPHLLENVELKKLPGLIWSSVRDEAENPRDWRGAAQSTTGWSLAAWSKRVTAGQGLSPARLRCPRCHQPCLAFHPAPGMAQEASPQHLLGKVDFPATLLHPGCPLPAPSRLSPPREQL